MSEAFRALFIGDIHMSNALPLSRPTTGGRTDRLEDQIKMWEQVHAYVVDHGIKTVFILGDLWDKKLLDAVTLTETVRAVTSLPAGVIIVPGNHDANNLKGSRYTVEVFGAMKRKNIVVMDAMTPYVPAEWLQFWGMPYAPVDETRLKLEEMRAATGDDVSLKVLLFHNSILGCRHLGWECDDGIPADEVCEGFHHVISGHFHTSQVFGPEDRGMYLGAPMQHNFGDVGEVRGFWDMTFVPSGRSVCELIPVEAPRFFAVTSLDDITEAMVDMNHGDYLRVSISATRADWVTMKPRVVAVCEQLGAAGFRVRWNHVPIYHHEARMIEEATTGFSLEDAITQYVESTDVVLGSLDRERLRQIAHQALAASRQS